MNYILIIGFIFCIDFVYCQDDPCNPNPCGENTICLVRTSSLISCSCKEGFKQTVDGCQDLSIKDSRFSSPTSRPLEKQQENIQQRASRFPSSHARPSIVPHLLNSRERDSSLKVVEEEKKTTTTTTRSSVIEAGSKSASVNIISNGEVEKFTTTQQTTAFRKPTVQDGDIINPRFNKNPFKRAEGVTKPNSLHNVDNLFPEECLINEDCPSSDYCDPQTRSCINACLLNICGKSAECLAKLNRPVCYCPKGYIGNPYRQCTQAPSRVGLRFRRNIQFHF